MIEQIFLKIVNMGITAGYCMVIVLLLRILIRKLPKVYSYVLWSAVYFRLVCPVSLKSTLSLIRMKTEPIPENIGTQMLPRVTTGAEPVDRVVNHMIQRTVSSADMAAGASLMQSCLSAAGILWVTVLCLLLAGTACSYIRLRLQLRGAVLLEEGVYEKKGIKTPFVIGLRRPKIYLPPGMEEQEKRFVLEHEKTHIRHKDHLVKQAAYLVSCVHWFQPLVWLAFYLMCRDMEMSCDESVIRKLGKDVRKEYSAALLSLSSGRKVVLGSPLAFGEGGIRSRIVNVLRYRKRAVWVSLVLAVAIAGVTLGLALNPEDDGLEYKNKKTPTELENIIMATGVMPFADGTDVMVELCMTDGVYYNDTMEEYLPSIYTYGQNYEGSYILRTKNGKGEILYQYDLEQFWTDTGIYFRGGTGYNFPEEFPLLWTDYNSDGCPDFTIGMPLSSSNKGYLLLTVREDGRIEKLCSENLVNSMGEHSMVFEHDTQAEQMPILGYYYDNAAGEGRHIIYRYHSQKGIYEREPEEKELKGSEQEEKELEGSEPEEEKELEGSEP